MKRLAVSLLFILIAATFTSDATAAFGKFRLWTVKIRGFCAAQVCNRFAARDSALMSAMKGNGKDEVTMIQRDGDRLSLMQDCATANQVRVLGAISPHGKTVAFNSAGTTTPVSSQEGQTQGIVLKPAGSSYPSEAFDFITTAARQIHELLGLMRIK